MIAGLRTMPMRAVLAFTFMIFFALFQAASAGGSGSYPKAEYNGLSFPSYALAVQLSTNHGKMIIGQEHSIGTDGWSRVVC